MKRLIGFTGILLIAVHLGPFPALGDTIRIPADQPTIQAGIDASTSGDTVLVAPGTYFENIAYDNKDITLRSEGGPAVTVIDGSSVLSVIKVKYLTAASAIEGFTIRNGSGTEGYGGGIYCEYHASLSITNCTITENTASNGGGIACRNYCDATIENCLITGNSGGNGGGLRLLDCSPTISQCSITGNSASLGGGIIFSFLAYPTITDCTISDNTATDKGGGVYYENASGGLIGDCTISNNHVTNPLTYTTYGGGIYARNSWAGVYVRRCMISHNSADNGGGIASEVDESIVTNCTIYGNNASGTVDPPYSGGGGIFVSIASPEFANCTIVDNEAQGRGDGVRCISLSDLTLVNCILWNTDAGDPSGEITIGSLSNPSVVVVSHCDIPGGPTQVHFEEGPDSGTLDWAEGNLTTDPLFAGATNFHLSPTSPCIDAGTNMGDFGVTVSHDIDGEVMPMGVGYDIGSDEYTQAPLSSATFDVSSGNPGMGYPSWNPVSFIYTDQVHITANGTGAPGGLRLPIWVTLTQLYTDPEGHPLTVDGGSRDYGDGGVGSGWVYDAGDLTGGQVVGDVLQPGGRVSRTWVIEDPDSMNLFFWADVFCVGVESRTSEETAVPEGSFHLTSLDPFASLDPGQGTSAKMGDLLHFVTDDGTPELLVGGPEGGLVMLNRFDIEGPAEVTEIAAYLGETARASEVDLLLFFDPAGSAPAPEGLEEIHRARIVVEEPGFQSLFTDGLVLTPEAGRTGTLFVGVESLPGQNSSLGIDFSTPVTGAGIFSTDGGLTFHLQSDQPIMDGNFMIRALLTAPEIATPCSSITSTGSMIAALPLIPALALLFVGRRFFKTCT